MTINEIIHRLTGTDHIILDLNHETVAEIGPAEVREVLLSGVDQRDGRPFLFRLCLDTLRETHPGS